MLPLFFTLLSFLLLLSLPTSAIAQTPTPNCTIIYGGGKTDCTQAPVATATPTLIPQATNSPTTTKGGLPVHDPSKAATTPATGPEMVAIFGLIPTAIAGWYLRKKSHKT